jgi:hypothetical protein
LKVSNPAIAHVFWMEEAKILKRLEVYEIKKVRFF